MDEMMMPDFSQIWPEWKAVKKVGEGSFGKVYKCVRSEYDIQTECAVKVISIPKNDSEINAIRAECSSEESVKAHFKEIVDEFANEIKMMVLLKGAPNIVSVENYKIVERKDTIGWDIYIQMEFLTTFGEFAKNHAFTELAVARLASDLCSALEVCEEKNIIHRDIKPDNIFIDNYGNYKIGDFGVARKLESVASAMSKKGTYTYMAPEVYNGKAYDKRADIYSLGMVMYKLLNRGRDPFTDPYADAIPYKEREAALVSRMGGSNLPAPVNASINMSKIIIKACAFDPKNRFSTPGEFKAALREYIKNATEPSRNKPVQPKDKENLAGIGNKTLPLFMDGFDSNEKKAAVQTPAGPVSSVQQQSGVSQPPVVKAPTIQPTASVPSAPVIQAKPVTVPPAPKAPGITAPVLKTPGITQSLSQNPSVAPVIPQDFNATQAAPRESDATQAAPSPKSDVQPAPQKAPIGVAAVPQKPQATVTGNINQTVAPPIGPAVPPQLQTQRRSKGARVLKIVLPIAIAGTGFLSFLMFMALLFA